MWFISNTLSIVVVLGALIVLHEFGHFAAAKMFGVRVDQFAIGFGKRLFGFRKGDTDYRVNLLPLGGYVKMCGENPLEARSGDPREFLSQPRWHRFVIALAGPAMNIVIAIALLAGVYMVHYEHAAFLDEPVNVGWVVENSAGARAGILPGDRIVRIDNVQNPTWEDALYRIMISAGQPMDVAIQRGNEVLTRKLTPEKVGRDEIGNAGLEPEQKMTVAQIEPNMPAQRAGIRIGDEVLRVNGTPVHSVRGMLRQLQDNGSKPADVLVLRNGQELKVSLTPVKTDQNGEEHYRIGVAMSEPFTVVKLPFTGALSRSLSDNTKNSSMFFLLVERMAERRVSIKQLSSPISMSSATGAAVREPGWSPILSLTSMISLQLGILNLFPIPILDGGIIMLLLIEGLMRREISMQVKERLYQAAFLFLVLFAVVVIYNDLAKAIPGLGRP